MVIELETQDDIEKESTLPLMVRDLHKRYKNGAWANRGITLDIQPVEILGILGPNGAGKTTLVRQITTELLPTSGQVRIMGRDAVTEPNEVKALLGIVPQEATLFEYLTVRQHLRIFGKLRGLTPKNAAVRADELTVGLRLEEYRDTPISSLSGGMRRRILIGLAALAHPPLMVLDEPTTGLDPQSRRDLWSLLRSYREQGSSVLLTTHYMEEAEALCDRVGIINDGKLLALDTVENLRASYGYRYKVIYSLDKEFGEAVTVYGADNDELVEKVRAQGIQDYAVSRTSLEDVYLAFVEKGSDEERHVAGR
jgi:ABC-2 type transport system ATP-binding protein